MLFGECISWGLASATSIHAVIRGSKQALVPLGFLLMALGLYTGLVALEYYWNVPDWQPRWDSSAALIFAWLGVMVSGAWLVAGLSTGRTSRILCAIPSLALIALAVYVAGPEPLKPGFLGREFSSPLWYRGGRFLLLSAPALFCAIRLRRNGRHKGGAPRMRVGSDFGERNGLQQD